MFSDSEALCSGFSTNWRVSRACEDSSTQTLELSKGDQSNQTNDLHVVGVQTEDNEARVTGTKYDEGRLSEFLGRICPIVVTELDRISRSNAFASYSLIGEEEEEVLEVLNIPHSQDGLKVVDLSWSCTGSVLAVACSHTLHSGWCDHQGLVSLYNIDRENKGPSSTLKATSCVRCVSMHPYISSIVAAGTLSGEVVVWDVARDVTLSKVSPASHNDSVSQISWTLGSTTAVTLTSAALDGHLILWKVSPHLSTYQVAERYTLDVSSSGAGVTAFCFPHHKQDVFIACLEGGAMFHCSTTVAKTATSVGSLEPLKDPVISSFEPHPATVTSVQFSPHHDDVFATVATDQAIRIFSLSQRCSQRVIWAGGVVGLGWSPAQAHVLAAWGDASRVKLYNANTGDTLVSLAPDSREDKVFISCVRFNSKSNRLLAVGDLAGTISVWEIPSRVSTTVPSGVNN